MNDALKACYTNVGGMQAAAYQNFLDYDVICYAETFRYGADTYIDMPGFTSYVCNRAQGQHGGLQVSLRDNSNIVGRSCGVVVRCEPRSGIVWVQLPQSSILIAVCYFAPHTSRLYEQDVLDVNPVYQLFEGIAEARQLGYDCIILGDLNTRVGKLHCDVPMAHPGNHLPEPLLHLHGGQDVVYAAIPRQRNSMDEVVHSSWGNQLMEGLRSNELVLLNGRAHGDEDGKLTYFQPPGRGQGKAGASVVDLGCISAACFSHVQRFEVMPLELTRSPDHCTICLELTIPNTAAGSAQQVQRVKVYRPFGKTGTEAYRLQVAHADPQFADILQGMTEGRITLESAVSNISRILKACCATAMSGNSQPQPRSGQGAPLV